MSSSKKLYTQQRFIFMSLDPVHIGTGGYRLGRVDNAIIREPGTNLPKIPGTSLAGATRDYAAMSYGKPEAAGLHKKLTSEQKENCPIVYTFGTTTKVGGGQRGKVSIGDARILFFPVHSMAGPVWVSTKEILDEAEFKINVANNLNDETAFTSLTEERNNLNLGWLLLKTQKELKVTPSNKDNHITCKKGWKVISSRIVLVSQKLFSQIVNSNLEVRTSVAIDPETGAAEDKALFTYEALPRTTWLWFDVIEDDYLGTFPTTGKQFKRGNGNNFEENKGDSLGEQWNTPLDVVRAGLKLIEYLGVGGMGTRGFGRMKVIYDWEVGNDES